VASASREGARIAERATKAAVPTRPLTARALIATESGLAGDDPRAGPDRETVTGVGELFLELG
jgi:hypothetical protein